MTRVLVAHASKYGSVEEVARYVAAVLRDQGAACDVVAAREAPGTGRLRPGPARHRDLYGAVASRGATLPGPAITRSWSSSVSPLPSSRWGR